MQQTCNKSELGKPVFLGELRQQYENTWLVRIPFHPNLNGRGTPIVLNVEQDELNDRNFRITYNTSSNCVWSAPFFSNESNKKSVFGLLETQEYYVLFPISKILRFKPDRATANEIESINTVDTELKKRRNDILQLTRRLEILGNAELISSDEETKDNNKKSATNASNGTDSSTTDLKLLAAGKKKSKTRGRSKSSSKQDSADAPPDDEADWDYEKATHSDDQPEDLQVKADDSLYDHFMASDSDDPLNDSKLSRYGKKLTRQLANFDELAAEHELNTMNSAENNLDSSEEAGNLSSEEGHQKPSTVASGSKRLLPSETSTATNRLETAEKIQNVFLNYIREHPGSTLKAAIKDLKLELRGNRIEIIRSIVHQNCLIRTVKDSNNEVTRLLYLKEDSK